MKRRFQAITPLVDAYRGRAAIVVGGGPSTPEQLAGFPLGDALILGANDHVMRSLGRADYLVGVDPVESRLRAHGVPIISPRRWADIRVFDEVVSASGPLAAYVAWIFGCSPIVVAGMDCFQPQVPGERAATYHHDPLASSSGHGQTRATHLNRWRKLLEICHGARFSTLGGPTEEVFPKYPERLGVGLELPTADKRDLLAGVAVRFTQRPFTEIPPVRFFPGEEWEVSRSEAAQALRARHAVRLEKSAHG